MASFDAVITNYGSTPNTYDRPTPDHTDTENGGQSVGSHSGNDTSPKVLQQLTRALAEENDVEWKENLSQV